MLNQCWSHVIMVAVDDTFNLQRIDICNMIDISINCANDCYGRGSQSTGAVDAGRLMSG